MNNETEESNNTIDNDKEPSKKNDRANKPGFLDVVKSVVSAMFGIQSDANRERDFNTGKASDYIIGGVIFTVVFVIVLFKIVGSVIESSGS